jgi:plastocyanin
MTRMRTMPGWMKLAATAAGALLVGGVATAFLRSAGAGSTVERTIELSMRDFTFNGNNPVLRLKAGETVQLIVRNDEPDPRVLHSFRIPGLDIRCDASIRPGEQREFVFRVPSSGDYVYTCCTHPGMGGAIQIARDR